MSEHSNDRETANVLATIDNALARLTRTRAHGRYRLTIDLHLAHGNLRAFRAEQAENQRDLDLIRHIPPAT